MIGKPEYGEVYGIILNKKEVKALYIGADPRKNLKLRDVLLVRDNHGIDNDITIYRFNRSKDHPCLSFKYNIRRTGTKLDGLEKEFADQLLKKYGL